MHRLRYMALSLVIVILVACQTDRQFAETNQARARPVLEAIYEYKDHQGSFPEVLDDLVPTYLAALPSTTTGEEFFYATDSLNGFILSFSVRKTGQTGFGCGYTDKERRWDCGYGD